MRYLAWVLVFIADGVAFVLAIYKLSHREWFSGVLLALIGFAAAGVSIWSLRSAAALDAPLEPLDPAGRIVMRATGEQLGNALLWAVGFLGVAIGLAENPAILWSRWLSYPAAVVALFLAGVVIWTAQGERIRRFVADSRGFDTYAGVTNSGADSCCKIAWSQVGSVKRIESRPQATNTRRNSLDAPVRRELVFFDREGEELLRIDDALDPPERYKLFLESIPRWTGLEIKLERTH